jgi:hypothetical protein
MTEGNLKSPHTVIVGTLGDLVHQTGGLTAALGNSDTMARNDFYNPQRYGALMAMDSDGIVDRGRVSFHSLEKNEHAPYGVRADVRRLFSEFRALHADPQVSLIVVDFGDTYRADVYAYLCPADVALRHKQNALERADALLGKMMDAFDRQRDLLLVLSLSMPKLNAGELLPVMAWGQGIQPKTYLTSGSTRRAGFITPADVTATVAQFVGAPSASNVLGRAVSTTGKPQPATSRLHRLARYNRLIFITDHGLRFWTFVVFALLEAAVLLACVSVMTFLPPSSPQAKSIARKWLMTVALLPFAVHFINAMVPMTFEIGWGSILMALIWITMWVSLVWTGIKNFDNSFHLLLTASGLLLMIGGLSVRFITEFNTIFGYSSYYGGRYYGLGNATTSILLGWGIASMSFARGKMSPLRLGALALWFAFLTGIIAFPQAGADAGGAVGAVATFAPTWLVAKGVRLNGRQAWRSIGMLIIVLVVVVIFVSLLDVRRAPEDRTHLGRLVAQIQELGVAPLLDMFVIKARVWGRTFGHWHWDICLGAIVVTTLWLLLGLRHRLVPLLTERPAMNALLHGGTIGTVITFLLNDSGPIITGLMGLYVLSPPLYLLLKDD